ncbi:MAG: ABC transporter ATP-binding protein [Candidatus Binatia bacterium]
MLEPALIHVEDLIVEFRTESGRFRAVDSLSLALHPGETVGLVGESGSGKTVTALSIMRLMDERAEIVGGRIWFMQEDLLKKTDAEMRRIRGRRIGMIFQEPMTSLNPAYIVGEQIAEIYRHQLQATRAQAKRSALEMFERVKLPSSKAVYTKYPHELSGGMRQRVMIAAAIACKPDLLIADEPTTALDVSIQAQILALLQELQSEMGMAVLFISHNLEVVAELCTQVAVVYGGNLVEVGSVDRLFQSPAHPYTEGLLRSIPQRGATLRPIAGAIFDPRFPPSGCRFHPRCPYAQERCRDEIPAFGPLKNQTLQKDASDPHGVSCHFPLSN